MRFFIGTEKKELPLRHMVNAGYAGIDQSTVRAHIEELAAVGVPGPKETPTFYPVPLAQLTQAETIQVCNGETSAEVEYVVLYVQGKRYLTVGSDHSDRRMEAVSVPAAKQICPNVIAKEVWDLEAVAAHLPEIRLCCEAEDGDGWRIYQEGKIGDILPPEELAERGRALTEDREGLVLYSGTIPVRGGLSYAGAWRIRMEDPITGRSIETAYRVEILPEAIE